MSKSLHMERAQDCVRTELKQLVETFELRAFHETSMVWWIAALILRGLFPFIEESLKEGEVSQDEFFRARRVWWRSAHIEKHPNVDGKPLYLLVLTKKGQWGCAGCFKVRSLAEEALDGYCELTRKPFPYYDAGFQDHTPEEASK